MKSIKKNFIYNTFYQLLRIILPIITVPYVSRVLGVKNIGIYSFTYSIVYYFILFSLLGINSYGNREIAKNRHDIKELSKTFLSIYVIQVVMTTIMIIIYLLYTVLFVNDNKYIAIIQIIYLIATLFDVNWFFFGLEEFKITVIRNTIIKILSVILIFIFVKSSNDLHIYVFIMALSTLLSEIILFIIVFKKIKFVKISLNDIVKHIKPCLILFIPVVSISLYNIMDKIMLGAITNMSEVGYYEQSEKIISIPLTLITSLGTVMMPRISNLISTGEEEKVIYHINKSMDFMMFFSFPLMLGIIAISDTFIPIFLGEQYTKSSILLSLLALPIIFKAIGNVTRVQYMTPHEMDKEYVYTTMIGAVVNLIINFILIPKYESIGACIGTIFAEFFVVLYMILILKNKLPFNNYFGIGIKYFISSIFMFIIIYPIKYLKISSIIILILQITIGGLIYLLLNIKTVKEFVLKNAEGN